jgi:hypothetical protein
METHELEIEITPAGEIRVHVKGVKGPACMEYAELIEEILGTSGTRERTSEYYEEGLTRVSHHVGGSGSRSGAQG